MVISSHEATYVRVLVRWFRKLTTPRTQLIISQHICAASFHDTEKKPSYYSTLPVMSCLPPQSDTALKACTDYRIGGT